MTAGGMIQGQESLQKLGQQLRGTAGDFQRELCIVVQSGGQECTAKHSLKLTQRMRIDQSAGVTFDRKHSMLVPGG